MCYNVFIGNLYLFNKGEKYMLKLTKIVKDYRLGDNVVHALRGVDLSFRKSEFVSILGQSGCGKTTLLNIIGGLDRYTSGDLSINGKSTKDFKSAEWDSYRNHSIGFVFQNYNLIPHQTVLKNVELALTLSGVSRHERRQRAIDALTKVGLGDQLHKKPAQMSGGQMQRVAIARALVNNPDILLADEPTGALDSETSVQIMEILKEIAKDKLIIMVTHNPELAEKYSTRIIRLLDGRIVSDSNPYEAPDREADKKKVKKTSMSFFTALSLSFNNLMTKKTRTFLTSFAGSIGIIGIALILSVSTGVNAYIADVEENTMSSYPITITETAMDMTSMVEAFMSAGKESVDREQGKIYSNDVMIDMMKTTTSGFTSNDLKSFKKWIDGNAEFKGCTNDIKYVYSTNMNTYLAVKNENGEVEYRKSAASYTDLFKDVLPVPDAGGNNPLMAMASAAWKELVGSSEMIAEQYAVVDGRLPENPNEIVLMVDKNNGISDFVLYMLGVRDPEEIKEFLIEAGKAVESGTENPVKIEPTNYTFEELYALDFRIIPDSDYYGYNEEANRIYELSEAELNELLSSAQKLKIVGIVKPSDESLSAASTGGIGYLGGLTASMIEKENNSITVKKQSENDKVNLLTGMPFSDKKYTEADLPILKQMLSMNPEFSAYVGMMSDAQLLKYANENFVVTKEKVLDTLGYVDLENPSGIYLYPADFDSKDKLTEMIAAYNLTHSEAEQITYSDTVGMLISSVTTIVDVISYVLVAFVAISLVVSSIMIGIITYISVLERTKEIGILRAIGASKKDIARVFNAETLTVGFVSGALGIGLSLLLIMLINLILHALTGIPNLNAVLPVNAAVILVAISMFLTFIAGLIPSRIAARKDPVTALASE